MAQEIEPNCFPAVTVHPEPTDITCNQGGPLVCDHSLLSSTTMFKVVSKIDKLAFHAFCWQSHTLEQAALPPEWLSDIGSRAVGTANHLSSSCHRKR